MKLGNSALILGLVLTFSASAGFTSLEAQELRGFPDMSKLAEQVDQKAAAAKSWTQRMTSPLSKGIEAPKPINWPKFGLFKNADNQNAIGTRPNLFGNFPKLFPERDANSPNLFQDMNERSKEWFQAPAMGLGKWASDANERAKNRTMQAWDSLTENLKNPLNGLSKKPQPPMAQPPIRSAQRVDGTPKIRY